MIRPFTSLRVTIPLTVLPLLLLGCGSSEEEPPNLMDASAEHLEADPVAAEAGYTNITAERLAELMERGDDYLVVNVHVPDAGEIPGTDVHIPFDEIEAHQDELPAAKDAPIVVYCRSGRMSEIASETLASMGYTNLLHLEGGMNAWQAADHSLQETGAGQ